MMGAAREGVAMASDLDAALGEHAGAVDVLAGLVRERGAEPFLERPLLSPALPGFPGDELPDADWVAAVVARLARLAGLAAVPLRVEDRRGDFDVASVHQEPVLPYLGRDGEVAVFAIDTFGAADLRVAALCHEVALLAGERPAAGHPYRRGSAEPAPFTAYDLERAAVATVWLGFGLVTANGAHRFAATGAIEGYSVRSEWSHGRVGALSAGALCCLLAVQALARDEDADPYALGAHLHESQRRVLATWVATLSPHRTTLLERLGLAAARRATQPDVAAGDEDPPVAIVRRSIHRVLRRRTGELAFVGALLGLAVGLAALVVREDSAAAAMFPVLSVLGAVVGGVVGRARPRRFCSAWDCGSLLEPDAATCGGCGGRVAGEMNVADLDRYRAGRAEEESLGALAEEQYAGPNGSADDDGDEAAAAAADGEADDDGGPVGSEGVAVRRGGASPAGARSAPASRSRRGHRAGR
jgi:hypothetical protein